ncbi:MAG: tandem-95 repeat protein, partial [Verrucomicrobia bacterium]|nr:tandem-95 repeat protein [Verrucomicrobiota bacterium]
TSVNITLTGSDQDSDTISFAVLTLPANGTLSGSAPNLTYTPNTNFNGIDSFTFKVNDGKVDSAEAELFVRTVTADDAPVAGNDSGVALTGFPQSIGNVLTNDFDIEGAVVTLLDFTQPSNGTLTSNGDGTFTYVARAGFTGVDSFTYRISDGTRPSAPATVTLTVSAPGLFRWINTAGGNWSTPGNWSANRVPTPDDDVFLTEPGTYTVTVDLDVAVRRLIVGAGSGTQTLLLVNRTLEVSNDSFIGGRGVFRQAGGVVEAQAGRWTIEGGFEWTDGQWHGPGVTELMPSSTVTLGLPNRDLFLNNGRRLVNRSTLVLQARRLFLANTAIGGAAVENLGQMTFDGEADLEWSNSSSQRPVRFANQGLLIKNGAGVSRMEAPFSSTGPVQVLAGTLQFQGGGTQSGAVTLDAGGILSVFGGEWVLTGPVTGNGTLQLAGGTLQLGSDQSVARFVHSNGDLTGPGNLQVSGAFQWTDGRQVGNAITELLPGTAATISGGAVKQLVDGRVLLNRATLEVTGNWIYLGNPNTAGAGIRNLGTLSFQEANGVYWNSSDNNRVVQVENAGTITTAFNPADGNGTRLIAPFANSGNLLVTEGRLGLERGSGHSGALNIGTNGVLSLQGWDHAFAAGSRLSGAGALFLTTGSATFDSTLAWSGPITVMGGTVAFNAPQTLGSFSQSDGVVTGSGTVVVTNQFAWNAGRMTGDGVFEVAASASVITGAGNKFVGHGRRFINQATFTLAGNLFLGNNTDVPTRFENRGTFIFTGGEAVPFAEWDGVKALSFANLGTLEKRGASTVSYVDVPFENSGVVQVREGTLRLQRDGIHSGSVLVAEPARWEITRGTHRLVEGNQWGGSGALAISSSTLALETALPLGALKVQFSGGMVLMGEFPVSNDPGGELVVDQNLTFPGDLNVAGSFRIGAANRTVVVAGTLGLGAASLLDNPGTLRVGALVDAGSTMTGNPPEVIGLPPEGQVVITAILRTEGSVEPRNGSGNGWLILQWQAPTPWGYTMESSANLSEWTPIPGDPVVLAVRRFETRIPTPPESAQYFRIRWNGAPDSGGK